MTTARILAGIGLLICLGLIAYFGMVLGVRRCYFPDASIADVIAILLPSGILAIYFTTCIWYGRFLWMLTK